MIREYADPPIIDPTQDAATRRAAGKARRGEVSREDVLRGGVDSQLNVLLAGPSAHVVPVAESADVLLDLIDVDDMLPGPFEVDLCAALAVLAPTTPKRKRGVIAHSLGFGYAEAIEVAARAHAHDRLQLARHWSARLARRLVKSDICDTPWSAQGGVAALVHSSGSRLRRGRVRHLLSGRSDESTVSEPPASWEAEWRQYRETLTEAEQDLLRWYSPIEVLGVDDDLIVLARGSQADDLLVLHARATHPSPLESEWGVWRQGSDVQRVLVARSRVPLEPEDLLGWSTSPDGLVGRAWGRLRLGRMRWSTSTSAQRDRARDHGRILGLSHARTGDVHALRGFVGNPASFAKALSRVSGSTGT